MSDVITVEFVADLDGPNPREYERHAIRRADPMAVSRRYGLTGGFRQGLFRMHLMRRGGQNVCHCPDFPPHCVHELVTGHEEQLTDKVHHCGMYRHGIRVRVVSFGPEEIREELGDQE